MKSPKKRNRQRLVSRFGKQKGAALIIGLVMLLLLTIIGLSAMQGTAMQEKMSGNMRDANLALQAGEAGMRYLEEGFLKSIEDLDIGKTYGGCSATAVPRCQIINSSAGPALPSNDTAAWDAQAISYGSYKEANGAVINPPAGSDMNTLVAFSPLLMVEYVTYKRDALDDGGGVTDDRGSALYRNTIKAYGGSVTSEAILQTVFARRFR
ncbi:PilX N-terminal domain-containing pilus assembly protein [Neptunomonas sp.]|uniref:pilus assembly PilX family protein n=1 Tax=Neptunomonas sp. TaxID=1971898 RepID=UPI003565BF02